MPVLYAFLNGGSMKIQWILPIFYQNHLDSDQQIAEKFLIIYGGVLIHGMVIFVSTPHVMLLTQTTGGRDS
jgi:hypothetical protein